MKTEMKTRNMILSEMVAFLFHHDIPNLFIETRVEKDVFTLYIHADTTDIPKKLVELIDYINKHKNLPTDHYYQELLGVRDDLIEQEVLAVLLTDAHITHDGETLEIFLKRDPSQKPPTTLKK